MQFIMQTRSPRRFNVWLPFGLALIVLAVFIVRLWDCVGVLSLTADEPVHIAAGVSYLTHQNFAFNREHPPLVKMAFVALPYLFHGNAGDNPGVYFQPSFVRWTRAAAISLSVLLALLLLWTAVVSYDSFWIGLFVLSLYTLEPTILAHAIIVHTDIAAAFGYFLFFVLVCWWWKRPSVARTTAVAASAALGCLLKYSLVVLPLFVFLLLGVRFITDSMRAPRKAEVRALLVRVTLAVVVICFLIQAGYLFSDFARPAEGAAWTKGLPVPRQFLSGLSAVVSHQQRGHPAYFLGEFSQKGWVLYFPVAVLLKVALPTLIWWVAGAVCWLRRQGPERYLWLLMVAAYLCFSLNSSVNIGIRHLLPIFPFFCLAAGQFLLYLIRKSPILAFTILFLTLGWLGAVSFRIHPQYIAYFNELAGGPAAGWRYLSDSNADWGQTSKLWAEYARQHPQTQFKLGLHPADPPSNYGAGGEDLIPLYYKIIDQRGSWELPQGTYAVSTAFLISERIPQLAFLRTLGPIDIVAHTIRVYRVGPQEQAAYVDWLRYWKSNPRANF